MSESLSLLSDEEFRRAQPADDQAGFGTLSTRRGHLPLTALDVQARLDGLLSEINVRQTFVNTLDEPLEATYIFPLPDRAAVTRFRMEVAGRVTEGVLQERGAARRQYQQAIQVGQRAAIAEEERPGVFSLRVGNLMPGEAAHITLSLVGPLPYSDGEATFHFPLVVAPRYMPGQPLSGPTVGTGVASDTDAVPDASRISPPVLLAGYPNPVRLSLSVAVQPGNLLLRDFRSSLHSVLLDADSDGVRTVRLLPGERLDRDFILRFRVAADAIQTSLALQPDASGDEGTFHLTLVPPALTAAQRPRDLVFVLDRSGSMAGWKIVTARRALGRMVETLTDRDRFTVYAFDDRIESPPALGGQLLAPGTDRHRFLAAQFLSSIEARGGTEMAQPLDRAMAQPADGAADRDRIVVLLTDGQVGNEDQILQMLGQRAQQVRIFTLGIDRAVNAAFLKRLAELGGGACELVESADRLNDVMDKVHRQIGTALVAALSLRAEGLALVRDSQTPARLPDLFAGAPLFVMGRYRGSLEQTVNPGLTVEGSVAGHAWAQPVAAWRSQNQAVPSVWARGRIRELEDRFAIGHGDATRLEKEILATSLRFGVLCRFTAFVAVDRQVVNEGGQVHQVTQAVEMPASWDQANDTMSAAAPPTAGVFLRGLTPHIAAGSRLPAPRSASLGNFKKGLKAMPDDAKARQAVVRRELPPEPEVESLEVGALRTKHSNEEPTERTVGDRLFLLLALPFVLVFAVVKLCWRALCAGFRRLMRGNAGSDNGSAQQPTPDVARKDTFWK